MNHLLIFIVCENLNNVLLVAYMLSPIKTLQTCRVLFYFNIIFLSNFDKNMFFDENFQVIFQNNV